MAEEKHTEFALKAMSLAELFMVTFGAERLVVDAKSRVKGGLQRQATYRMEISAPEGPSTGGGKQAVQHIKMIPEQGPTIVIGSVNQVEMTAELRTFEYLAYVHARRFKGAAVPLEQGPYNQLLKKIQAFCASCGLRLLMTDVPRTPDGKPIPMRYGSPLWMGYAIFALGLIVTGLTVMLLLKH
jgi:hypothetical protein